MERELGNLINKKKKIAIIGASCLQNPLIIKAKEMGLETHVFAWKCGDVGEKTADYFYPISIVEKDKILNECYKIGINGICTIATDLGVITVNYVANRLNLIGNSDECTAISTNKHLMRSTFEINKDPSPKSVVVSSTDDLKVLNLNFPVIVKPTDRSGSRGVTKLDNSYGLIDAVKSAIDRSFEKKAVIEEFIEGKEYSVECISYNGKHYFLALTLKYTTGSPHFIETGHLEPAPIDEKKIEEIKTIIYHALDSLKIKYGASHSEIKITKDGTVKIIEIGGRMGGDFIGSTLVSESTGIDFLKAVVDISMGKKPNITRKHKQRAAGIHFIISKEDIDIYNKLIIEHPEFVIFKDIKYPGNGAVVDSSTRFGEFIIVSNSADELMEYLPNQMLE